MFSKKAYENDMWVEMEHNLKKNALEKSSQYEKYKLKALTLLAEAVQELDDVGLHKEASHFLETLEKAEKDPVTKINSEQSVEKLKTRGWPLNAADDIDKTSDDGLTEDWEDEREPDPQQDASISVQETADELGNMLSVAELKQINNIWK